MWARMFRLNIAERESKKEKKYLILMELLPIWRRAYFNANKKYFGIPQKRMRKHDHWSFWLFISDDKDDERETK